MKMSRKNYLFLLFFFLTREPPSTSEYELFSRPQSNYPNSLLHRTQWVRSLTWATCWGIYYDDKSIKDGELEHTKMTSGCYLHFSQVKWWEVEVENLWHRRNLQWGFELTIMHRICSPTKVLTRKWRMNWKNILLLCGQKNAHMSNRKLKQMIPSHYPWRWWFSSHLLTTIYEFFWFSNGPWQG